jgi:hypothetical protein
LPTAASELSAATGLTSKTNFANGGRFFANEVLLQTSSVATYCRRVPLERAPTSVVRFRAQISPAAVIAAGKERSGSSRAHTLPILASE